MNDPLLTTAQAAERAGIKPGTWRGYLSRGYAPKPDEPDSDAPANRRNPKWRTSAVDTFTANRLKQGTRTDLKGDRP